MNNVPEYLRIEVITEFKGKRINDVDYKKNPLIQSSLPEQFEFDAVYQDTLKRAGGTTSNYKIILSEKGIEVVEIPLDSLAT